MGDNRDNSADSRVFQNPLQCPNKLGYVPIENLVGKAEFIWFSLRKCTFLSSMEMV